MKKRIIFGVIFVVVCAMFSVSFASKAYIFPDIVKEWNDSWGHHSEAHPAARDITRAAKIGFIEGYPDGTFKPDNTISREEFVKMLMILATNWTFDFEGVDTEYTTWAGPYITIAEMQGVIDKNAYTVEEWKKPITRLETVLMLAKTQINMKGIPQNQIGQLKYKDINKLTQEEKDLILHAAKYDLLEGMREGTNPMFEPNKNLTRGEAAMALMRVY